MMQVPEEATVGKLLEPFVPRDWPASATPQAVLLPKLTRYLQLLLVWNERTNLTAVRDPREVVTRHFGESLLAGFGLLEVAGETGALLDVGSGAGFPGLPMALLLPGWWVTLAESQGKKASFLQEAVRTLEVDVRVWPRRVESMSEDAQFDAVTLRAVDRPEVARELARKRLRSGGWLCELTSRATGSAIDAGAEAWGVKERPVAGSADRVLRLSRLP